MEPMALTQPDPLRGRIALITGVSRRAGIGCAITRRLTQLGASLMLHSWTPYDATQPYGSDSEALPAMLDEVRGYGRRVEHIEADFRDPAVPEQVAQAATEAFGACDILIPNHAHSVPDTLEDLTAASIDAHLETNVRGTLLLVRAWAARYDDTRPGGRIVLLTSGQHLGPMPDTLAYAASKGALQQITQTLAHHLAPRGITVNAVNPGPTDTGWASQGIYDAVRARSPRGRWGTPDDAARVIAWLVTDDAEWVTGQVINSTGGL